MKFEVGKTYKTRNGRLVKIVATDVPVKFPVVGYYIPEIDGRESIDCFSWTDIGRTYSDHTCDSDLVEEYVEPIIVVKYFMGDMTYLGMTYSEFIPDLEKWDLKITYHDGKIVKAELPQ